MKAAPINGVTTYQITLILSERAFWTSRRDVASEIRETLLKSPARREVVMDSGRSKAARLDRRRVKRIVPATDTPS